MTQRPHLAFLAAESQLAQQALQELNHLYPVVPLEDADIIVALGGDGFLLQTLKSTMPLKIPVYGMNLGSIGFLMNSYHLHDLYEHLNGTSPVKLHPLKMTAFMENGTTETALALNEVSLLRQSHQAAKIQVIIDGIVRLDELICDGILLATPAGSTAYNFSAHGPIIPLNSDLLALTPLCPFRPRHWRGALLPFKSKVKFRVLEYHKRPMIAAADTLELRHVIEVEIGLEKEVASILLFDAEHVLEERILREQFLA